MSKPKRKRAPVAATTKGPNIRLAANASHPYRSTPPNGKPNLGKPFAHSARAREAGRNTPIEAQDGQGVVQAAKVTCHDSAGRKWAYRGKRARVVELLATMPDGVTQWDTLPWHTRLGGTIHALRRDGLEISTELEGPCRHARYRLHSPVRLIEQEENRQGGTDNTVRQR